MEATMLAFTFVLCLLSLFSSALPLHPRQAHRIHLTRVSAEDLHKDMKKTREELLKDAPPYGAFSLTEVQATVGAQAKSRMGTSRKKKAMGGGMPGAPGPEGPPMDIKPFLFRQKEYFAELVVAVGQSLQHFPVTFETVSSQIWIPSALCRSCDSPAKFNPTQVQSGLTRQFAKRKFNDGVWVAGYADEAAVSLSDIVVQDQVFYEAYVLGQDEVTERELSIQSALTQALPTCTIETSVGLGLAPPGTPLSLIENMVDQQLILPYISLFFSERQLGSLLIIGGNDRKLYTDELLYVPMVGTPVYSAWELQIFGVEHSYMMLEEPLEIDMDVPVRVDPGVSHILIPADQYDKFYHHISMMSPMDPNDIMMLPNVTFTFVGKENPHSAENIKRQFVLTPADYFMVSPYGAEVIFARGGSGYVFGTPWIRLFYTSFDMTQKMIGFAKALVEEEEPAKKEGEDGMLGVNEKGELVIGGNSTGLKVGENGEIELGGQQGKDKKKDGKKGKKADKKEEKGPEQQKLESKEREEEHVSKKEPPKTGVYAVLAGMKQQKKPSMPVLKTSDAERVESELDALEDDSTAQATEEVSFERDDDDEPQKDDKDKKDDEDDKKDDKDNKKDGKKGKDKDEEIQQGNATEAMQQLMAALAGGGPGGEPQFNMQEMMAHPRLGPVVVAVPPLDKEEALFVPKESKRKILAQPERKDYSVKEVFNPKQPELNMSTTDMEMKPLMAVQQAVDLSTAARMAAARLSAKVPVSQLSMVEQNMGLSKKKHSVPSSLGPVADMETVADETRSMGSVISRWVRRFRNHQTQAEPDTNPFFSNYRLLHQRRGYHGF